MRLRRDLIAGENPGLDLDRSVRWRCLMLEEEGKEGEVQQRAQRELRVLRHVRWLGERKGRTYDP